MALSRDGNARAFSLVQSNASAENLDGGLDRFGLRLVTTAQGNGATAASTENAVTVAPIFVAASWSEAAAAITVVTDSASVVVPWAGSMVDAVEGNLWDNDYRLVIGGEVGVNNRFWYGTLFSVALYCEALDVSALQQNRQAGAR